jgi:putative tryptophan/tyrosine transport system substrate-binding protein
MSVGPSPRITLSSDPPPSAAILWPLASRSQQLNRVRRVGFMRVGPPPTAFIDGFRRGMREQGFVEGQQFVIEYSVTESSAQMSDAVADLMRRKVEVILASGTPSVLPAHHAAADIPVVFVATLDPVATGLVASLAKPGGNLTGLTSISGDLTAKRLQLMKELLPSLSKIAILVRELSPTTTQYVQESRIASRDLGVDLQLLAEREPQDLDDIFLKAKESGALVVADDAEFTAHRSRIAELALKHRMPIISGLRVGRGWWSHGVWSQFWRTLPARREPNV